MDKGFSALHPFVCLSYYAFVLLFALLFSHPIYLLLLILADFIFLFLQEEKGLPFKTGLFYMGMGLMVFFVNPLTNHRGTTLLFYFWGNWITLEATVYGANMALSLIAILLSFLCYQKAVNTHKAMYLFSAILPKIAFMVIMALRFVPLLMDTMHQIVLVQRTRGLGIRTGSLKKRVGDGMQILKILITWSLEEGLQTADSMKARGYGLAKRSSYSEYSMRKKDRLLLILILLLAAVTFIGLFRGYGKIILYPTLGSLSLDFTGLQFLVLFAWFLMLPILEEGKEIMKWR